jgi:hypothetical protein
MRERFWRKAMRKKFSPSMLLLVTMAMVAGAAACGDRSADDLEAVDRELDLAMAADSLAALDDMPAEAAEEPAPRPASRPQTPPPTRTRTVEPEPEPEPRYRDLSVGAGAMLRVSLDEELSTETSNVGDEFTVTLLSPVTDDTHVILPAGTKIRGKVTALEPSGSASSQAVIRLDFGQVLLDGQSHVVPMTVAEANPTTRGRKSTEEKAVTIGAGAVVGGILGRVIGGNATGTIIGGVAGAAAGTAIALGTGDVDAVLEQGSEMVLRVEERVTVRRPA